MTIKKRAISYIKHKLSSNDLLDLISKYVVVNLAQLIFLIKYRSHKVDSKKIVFECFQGRNVSDSPLSLYKELINTRKDLSFVWVLNSVEHGLYDQLSNNSNTTVVIYNTAEYDIEYATAGYWITNCRLPFRLFKKKNQKYIQCWHGTPLKKLGLDIEVGAYSTTSMAGMRFSYGVDSSRYDYFLSPSKYASEKFCSSFNIPTKSIIELGYPRNDSLINDMGNTSKIDRVKAKLNINESKTVVLYAPTWRDKQYSILNNNYYFDNPLENDDFIEQFDDSFVFLFRGHYFTESDKQSRRFIDVSSYNDINDLFLISDILITDYSSVFFDFALLNRPIYFYMYDREHYEKEARGFYLDIDYDLPGEIFENSILLSKAVKSGVGSTHNDFNAVYNPFEDGKSACRIISEFL
ncbi:CDP-glycerol glycerophosphotransferase family protein [Photobacterium profundum]|uniref:CDP-glycerol glycerophosphotransferase family protein n=1 Tax=Photobacterium profundum TaxID=74109 RepID=UPI003D1290DA